MRLTCRFWQEFGRAHQVVITPWSKSSRYHSSVAPSDFRQLYLFADFSTRLLRPHPTSSTTTNTSRPLQDLGLGSNSIPQWRLRRNRQTNGLEVLFRSRSPRTGCSDRSMPRTPIDVPFGVRLALVRPLPDSVGGHRPRTALSRVLAPAGFGPAVPEVVEGIVSTVPPSALAPAAHGLPAVLAPEGIVGLTADFAEGIVLAEGIAGLTADLFTFAQDWWFRPIDVPSWANIFFDRSMSRRLLIFFSVLPPRGLDSPVHGICCHPSEPVIAVAGISGFIHLWNYQSRSLQAVKIFEKIFPQLCVYSKSGLLGVGFTNGQVRILNEDLAEVAQFRDSREAVTHLVFSEDSKMMAAAYTDRTVL